MKLGISELAVVPMRKEPSDRSEMVNQILFGETFEILEESEKWSMIRLVHDQYEGWIDNKQWSQCSERDARRFPIHDKFKVHQVREDSLLLSAGSMVEADYLSGEESKLMEEFGMEVSQLRKSAEMFLGTPYLWGGRTCMGIDCSGFTQIVFRLQGISLMRDASQQINQGEIVTFLEECNSGDLAFFDNSEGKIIHVGIIMLNEGNIEIIHASGKVRYDTLDHQGIFNSELQRYTHNLRLIKRLGDFK